MKIFDVVVTGPGSGGTLRRQKESVQYKRYSGGNIHASRACAGLVDGECSENAEYSL